ncbi:glycoside hydrolase family 88 protein [Lentisphaera profundi]|uniref:Glycoside hydrolase family 88 protein n=1 Tax=Lentisphaera profundi TaxID=1658616 RepID=A0ABY7VP86_9BACT|nr:glycoside hydrolase family 88 protein [Lentisphaera profundi]WDE95777.1 glycoside hydrolase family 88 protein [Lentisphaera profundi]
MKKVLALLAILIGIYFPNEAQANIKSKEFIKAITDKVDAYQFAHLSKSSNDNWIRGTYYSGVMAVFQSTGDKRYLEKSIKWGEDLGWKIPGIASGVYGSGFYSMACSQIWMECYFETKQEYMLKPTIDYINSPNYSNPVSDPLRWYYENAGLRFVDGLYTSPPALAMLNKITGEEKYLDWMDGCFWDIYGVLYDKDEGLFYRDTRYIKGTQEKIDARYIRPDSIAHKEARRTFMYQETVNGKKVLWSRGNGWAFGGISRILKYMPKDHGSYPRYKALYVRMATELKKRQQPDGFWRPNLDDPEDIDLKESSGTCFFTYGIAWGINNGILPRDEFLPVIEKSWPAIVSIISDEGIVQWGQLPAGAPYKVIKEDTHEYVTGMFLLAASELYKLWE